MMKRDKDRWSPAEWRSSQRRGETLVADLHLLLSDLCQQWGFCNALADDILAGDETLTADNFASRVLIAEGWSEAELPYNWRHTMMKVFVARYGQSISTADYDQQG